MIFHFFHQFDKDIYLNVSGSRLSKLYGLGPVGFPRRILISRLISGFPSNFSLLCRQQQDWIATKAVL